MTSRFCQTPNNRQFRPEGAKKRAADVSSRRESRIDACGTSPRAEASRRDARALHRAPRGRNVYRLRARSAYLAAQRVETVRRLGRSSRARKTETRRKSACRPIASRVLVRGSAGQRVGRDPRGMARVRSVADRPHAQSRADGDGGGSFARPGARGRGRVIISICRGRIVHFGRRCGIVRRRVALGRRHICGRAADRRARGRPVGGLVRQARDDRPAVHGRGAWVPDRRSTRVRRPIRRRRRSGWFSLPDSRDIFSRLYVLWRLEGHSHDALVRSGLANILSTTSAVRSRRTARRRSRRSRLWRSP